MIKLSVCKKYGERTVLDIPSIIFNKGEKYALIGANGSGKSTLLKLIAGIEKLDKGSTISFDNDNTKICYMPQKTFCFNLSLKNNVTIAIPTDIDNKERKRLIERRNRLIEDIGLSHLCQKNATTLSGGEGQKMALIRSLLMNHDIILLDEPTSAMDLNGTNIAEKIIEEYVSNTNCILIFATHSINQAKRLANNILFLDNGKVVEIISTRELNNPKTKQLKEFINKA